jgi:hypothetical protein
MTTKRPEAAPSTCGVRSRALDSVGTTLSIDHRDGGLRRCSTWKEFAGGMDPMFRAPDERTQPAGVNAYGLGDLIIT